MNYFESIDLFSDLSLEDQINLSDFCQTQDLNTWDTLFKQWDDPQAMYVIVSGKMLIQKQLQWWGMKDIAVLGDWDIVGEIAFFGNPPTRNATVTAYERCTLIVIIKFAMNQMLDKYPDLHENVKNIIEERTSK